MKENVLVVTLGESETKELASVLSNQTSKKILNALSQKAYTESDLAKTLKIPLSTVHYNVQQLVKAKLVQSEEYSYSKKGREIQHYKLTNKYIVIAPTPSFDILERLKTVLPVFIVAALSAGFIHLRSAGVAVQESARVIMDTEATRATVQTTSAEPNYALWFFGISVGAIILYVLFDYLKVAWNKFKSY